MESWKPCDFKTVLTFYTWLSEVWEKYDLLSVLFGSIVSNYSRIHWQKLISWKFDENFCIFCKIESIYVQINSLQIIKSTQTAILSRFRFTVFCYTKLVKFCHHVVAKNSKNALSKHIEIYHQDRVGDPSVFKFKAEQTFKKCLNVGLNKIL